MGHKRTSSKERGRSAFQSTADVLLAGLTELFRETFLWTSFVYEACVVEADRQTDL